MSKKSNEMPASDCLISRHPPHPQETPPMIINDISHLFHGKMRSTQTEGVLSQHGARMILSILSREEGLRQTDLVRMTHMKAPTISVLVKKMAAEGLLTHEIRFSDMRTVCLYLTDKGRQAHLVTHQALHTTDDILMQGFTEEETQLLKSMLCRMRNNLLTDLEQNGLLRPESEHGNKQEGPDA